MILSPDHQGKTVAEGQQERVSAQQRTRYEGSRYLEFVSAGDLEQRYLDFLDGLLSIRPGGLRQLTMRNRDGNLLDKLADLWCESDIRGLGAGWSEPLEQAVLNREYPRARRALDVWGDRTLGSGSVIKYGRRGHMSDFLESGSMRLTPASHYADTELTPAIRDDEQVFASYFPPGTRLQCEVPGSEDLVDIPDILGLIQMTQRCNEYFMFCTAAVFDPRAFDEFDYDACVIIHDVRKLIGMVRAMQVPARKLSAKPVTYMDPFMPHKDAVVEFTKHFRYRHQHEWRIVWTEPIPPPPQVPWMIELGDISSFCELVTL